MKLKDLLYKVRHDNSINTTAERTVWSLSAVVFLSRFIAGAKSEYSFLYVNVLTIIKCSVKAAVGKELFVASLLDDISVLHNQDHVGFLDS